MSPAALPGVVVAATSPVTAGNYADFLIHLSVDVVAVVILGVGLYYRRHRRRDLLTCIVCFNISLFVVLAVIDVRSTSLGVGFGLFALLLSAVVLVTVWLVDHPRLRQGIGHQQVTLDRVHADPDELRADLEQRLGAHVKTLGVLHTDYVQQTMLVDVRYEIGTEPGLS